MTCNTIIHNSQQPRREKHLEKKNSRSRGEKMWSKSNMRVDPITGNNGFFLVVAVSLLFVIGVPPAGSFSPQDLIPKDLIPKAAFKKAYFGLEGFIAKRKVDQNLDPTATKFLVDSDEDFAKSMQSGGDNDRAAFDHSMWDAVLKRHANHRGTKDGITSTLIDYAGIAKDPYFDMYTQALAKADLETLLRKAAGSSEANNELLALYINAYNCLCIGHVTRYYKASPKKQLPASITAVTDKLQDYKGRDIWDVPAGVVGGRVVTLNDIEHRILRSLWDEPRIHASIVCASMSCPDLRPEAFVAERINAQMDDQARSWVSDSTKGIRVNPATNQVTMSRIFLWFGEDFAPRNGPMAWAKYYHQGGQDQRWDTEDVEYFPYNWMLNNK